MAHQAQAEEEEGAPLPSEGTRGENGPAAAALQHFS